MAVFNRRKTPFEVVLKRNAKLIFLLLASSLLLSACSIENYPGISTNGEIENSAAGYNNDYNNDYSDSPGSPNDQTGAENNDSIIENNQFEESNQTEAGFKKPKVGLYTGKGSWPENITIIKHFLDYYSFPWSDFDEKDAVNINLGEEFDIIWLAGGFSAEYKHYIKDHSNIKSFVNEGGLFIGTCAGAYYAADILRWKGTDYEYPLKIFNGKGIGPMSGLINWGDKSTLKLKHGHPANCGFKPEKEVYYFDGPYFEPYAEEAVTVLAYYSNNNQPAIITGSSGKGHFLLMGPHPEIGDSWEQTAEAAESKQGAKWPWLYQLIIWVYNNSNG